MNLTWTLKTHGQSFENSSNMSEVYSELQVRIKTTNVKAGYVSFAPHSLNLFCVFAAKKS